MTNSEQTERDPGTTATEAVPRIDVAAIAADISRALTHSSEPWEYDDLAEMREQLLTHVRALLPATEEAAKRAHPHSVKHHSLTTRIEGARAQMGQPLDSDSARALHQVRQLALTGRLLLADRKRAAAR